MKESEVTGIIDIGSNTVRLSVYRVRDGAHCVIDQGRWPARLSQRLTPEGHLPADAVNELAEVLLHFRRICDKHGAKRIRAVATAAIRQAANREEALRQLSAATGLTVELLSGEDEARFGSEAMLRTLSLTDAFVVDIGGGSTEVSLLLDRRLVHSFSFPFGCVNTATRYGLGEGAVSAAAIAAISEDIRRQLARLAWISSRSGLPLVGLGGTVRALAKLRQRETDYPFPQLHGYEMGEPELAAALARLSALPADKRRKLPGLSKDRGDVIVPGLVILRALMKETAASGLVACGAGLRDGLFFDTCLPDIRVGSADEVLEDSIRNLNALYPTAPAEHLVQVRKLAEAMYDRLAGPKRSESDRRLLGAAARLFRIGAVIDWNDSADHTFYMLLRTHWNGLSHREVVMTAGIASYRSMGTMRRKLSPYRSMLRDGDFATIARLGSLLMLAASLDRSESQAIGALDVRTAGSRLKLTAHAPHPLPVERMETESLAKEFRKCWGLYPTLAVVVKPQDKPRANA